MPDRQSLRDRLRPYLLGAASLFDFSGSLTYSGARRAMPPADDWQAVGDAFCEAGRILRETMPAPVNPAAEPGEDGDRA